MDKGNIGTSSFHQPPELASLVAEIIEGKVSLFDLLRATPSGDYSAFVERQRLFYALARDSRILKRLIDDIGLRASESGNAFDNSAIAREIARKDGIRRFDKLVSERATVFNERPSFLCGTTFEACLEQYRVLIAHVEKMWTEACQLYTARSFPLAAFVSILVIEETGKLAGLAQDLVFWDVSRTAARGEVSRSHRGKHFVGVVSGALINARLDRILGWDVIRKILNQAESGELERIRQSCLYIDIQRGRTVTPHDLVGMEQAKVLTVLAGEIMAEVLGHFPWEFERMMESAIAFERAIGMPESAIVQQ